jgi:TonB family protein
MAKYRYLLMLCVIAVSLMIRQVNAAEQSSKQVTKEQWNIYMKQINARVIQHWHAPVSLTPSRTVISWCIQKDGSVSSIEIKSPGSSARDDQAAVKAVRDSAPFPPLPKEATEPCSVEFSFESVRPKPLNLTVAEALRKFGPDARKRLQAKFQQTELTYPPKQLTLIALKSEKLLLVFARAKDGKQKQLASYEVVSCSGELGPKLKEGDLQVPEGFYKTVSMDAKMHMCLWINYPNQTDRKNALLDHRTNLGGAIQIHEGVFSTGCIVVDHDDMAELFVLAHDVGLQNITLLMTPCNLLVQEPAVDYKKQPKWLPKLYNALKQELAAYPINAGLH